MANFYVKHFSRKILIIDNYDSFTYNIAYMLQNAAGALPDVMQNDQVNLNALLSYDAYVISPGPGLPHESGELMKVINMLVKHQKPILGICLGHQALATYFGGTLYNLPHVYHGVATPIVIDSSNVLYQNITNKELMVGRYHSWAVNTSTLPTILLQTGMAENDVLMSFSHSFLPIHAVQYHPDSILTPQGQQIFNNWIDSL